MGVGVLVDGLGVGLAAGDVLTPAVGDGAGVVGAGAGTGSVTLAPELGSKALIGSVGAGLC